MKPTHASLTLLLLAITSAGCATVSDDACVADRKIGLNGVSLNGVSLNGVSLNGVSLNKLGANGLRTGTLSEIALTTGALGEALAPHALDDDFTALLLAYTVSCALTPEQHVDVVIDGETERLSGGLGLAPAWGQTDGSCDAECQGWVSACLVARTNFKGESVQISLLGDIAALEPTEEEAATFAIEEATYYGDLFADAPTLFACTPDGADAPERTCGGDASGCYIRIVGECSAVCDADGCLDDVGRRHAQTITVNVRDEANTCG